jgi:trk system potassium uptake protein TrkH
MQEALNQLTVSGIVRLTQYVIKITLLIEFIGGTVLALHWYGEMGSKGIYFGYWHAIAGFCNAGFDLFGGFKSLTAYVSDTTVTLTMAMLIILGGIGFTVIFDVWENRRFSKFSLHTKVVLVTTVFLLLFGMVVILAMEAENSATLQDLPIKGKLLGSFFQSVSARTGGYHTVGIDRFGDATLFFIAMLMFIGASPGSTGGGVKTSTVGVLAAATWALVRGKADVEMFNRRLAKALVYKAFAIGFLASMLVIVVTMMLSISEHAPFLNILFEVVSAFGNVGLSTGITPTLSIHGKLWIIITMFAGRVGPATLALALALRQGRTLVQYPEGKVIIG